MRHVDYLELALRFAAREDERGYALGAVGLRTDGAIVTARNGAVRPLAVGHVKPGHAESRLTRKLDVGAVVYVSRRLRNGAWAMARPCLSCQGLLTAKGIVKVYYTIAPGEFGVLNLKRKP